MNSILSTFVFRGFSFGSPLLDFHTFLENTPNVAFMYDRLVDSNMTAYRIAILPGDGTGREVMSEAQSLLDAISANSTLDFEQMEIPCGGQYFLETGEEWPQGSFEKCRDEADAILLGAIGWPDAVCENGDLAGGQVVLGLRAGLDLYANVRPIKLYEGVRHKVHGDFQQVWDAKKVNMVIVRENTEGLYHSLLHRSALKATGGTEYEPPEMTFPGMNGDVAWDPRPISRAGSERVIKFAHRLVELRNGSPEGKKKLTCVDKSNVTRGCQLFRAIFEEKAATWNGIETDYAYIDAFTMWLVRNPEWFDVVVTSNMFGDIATDLGSVLQGGMGMAASGNIGDEHAFFEPVHGSSPKHAGKNIVNPIATLNSVQMMLEWLGHRNGDVEALKVAGFIDEAVAEHILEGKLLTYDLGGSASTSEVGSAIIERVVEKMS